MLLQGRSWSIFLEGESLDLPTKNRRDRLHMGVADEHRWGLYNEALTTWFNLIAGV